MVPSKFNLFGNKPLSLRGGGQYETHTRLAFGGGGGQRGKEKQTSTCPPPAAVSPKSSTAVTHNSL